jgi:peptidoglycan/LPS O-acetylase OafA/YrhL
MNSNYFIQQEDHFVIPRYNNWNLIRIICAFLVIYGHSFALFKTDGQKDILQHYLARGITYSGEIAVVCFFFLSGLLVTNSIFSSRSPLNFLVHRFLRVFPALFFCVAITIVVIHVITKNWYLEGSIRYLLMNISLVTNSWQIGDIFANNHYPSVINGSLWTLPNEIRCYIFILLISCLASFVDRTKYVALILISLFMLLYSPDSVPLIGSNASTSGNTLYVINSIFFLLGSLGSICRFGRVRSKFLLLTGIFLYGFWYLNQGRHLIFFAAIVLLTSSFATSSTARKVRFRSDISYGVYLYGFFVQQVIAYKIPNINVYAGFILASLVAGTLGWLSWTFVERHAIRLSKVISHKIKIEGKYELS